MPPYVALQDLSLTPDQLVEAASGTDLEVDVLSGGGAPSRLTCVRSPAGWGIDITTINAHVGATGGLNPGCVALLVVERPGDSNICGAFVDRSIALAMPVGSEIAASIRPGLAYATVVLPARHWQESLMLAGAAMPLGPLAVELAPQTALALLGACRSLAARLAAEGAAGAVAATAEPGAVPEAVLDYVAAFAEACHPGGAGFASPDRGRRLHHAWAARDYLRAHMAEDISIPRLCRVLGIGRRQLEYAFRSVFDVSPQAFLQALRLNESRRLLMQARERDQTVTQVAMAVGVSHLGRYAGRYRSLFGETPHQTLIRGGRA